MEIRHGTITGYYRQKCHCEDCKRAAREYYRQYAAQEPRKPCQIEGCAKVAAPRGKYCHGHRKRISQTGSPGTAETQVKNGDQSGYDAAHKRVFRARGAARKHQCVGCDRRAHQWAFIHGSPGAKPAGIKGNGRPHGPYSLNPDHYQPMCASCHKLYDREAVAS